MTEITVFSAPKPFTDPHINLIQRNAIRSWKQIEKAEILLIGQEEGLSGAAEELGVRHLAGAAKNRHGTPLISSIFELAREASTSQLLIYVNADIILFPELLGTVRDVASQVDPFLAVGHRWDLEVQETIDFSLGWRERLLEEVANRGRQQRAFAIDYFIFPRTIFTQIPDFAVGRAGWDNWMIYHAREKGWPVVDLTSAVKAVHQNHDYGHLPGGQIHLNLEESAENIELGGGIQNSYSILDADREYRHGTITRPRASMIRLLRKLELLIRPSKPGGKRWYLSRKIRKLWVRLEQGRL